MLYVIILIILVILLAWTIYKYKRIHVYRSIKEDFKDYKKEVILMNSMKEGSMKGGFKDAMKEIISTDSNYSSHISNVKHVSDSRFLFIYVHGMVPGGRKYSPMFIESIESTKYKNNSYGLYLRQISDIDNDNYNLDEELERFDAIIKDTYSDELKNDVKVVLLGHSYGATFVKYFLDNSSLQFYKVIALDGSLLYESIPYFIKLETGVEHVDTDEVEFTPTKAIYKNKNYVGTELISKEYYHALYLTKDNTDNRFNVVYYYGGGDDKNIVMEKKHNKHYRNYYELRFINEYSHSLHLWYPKCLERILDEIL